MEERIVKLRRTRIEVIASGQLGKPCSYRWVDGYFVVTPEGVEEHPPVQIREALQRAKELGATKIVHEEWQERRTGQRIW